MSELPASELPVIDQVAIDKIFVALTAMEIPLEENPLEFGPRHLNMKTAQARSRLAEVESLYLRVSSWIQKYKAAHRAAETLLDLNKKNLYTNDPETRAGRNVADREAIASIKLRPTVEELSKIGAVLDDLNAVLSAIKSKRADLKDIQGRIKDQILLCREEIGLGSRWGSKPPPGSKSEVLSEDPVVKGTSLRDLEKMFADGKPPATIDELLVGIGESQEPPLSEYDPDLEGDSDPVLGDLHDDDVPAVKVPAGAGDQPLSADLLHKLSKTKDKRGILKILENAELESFPKAGGYCCVCFREQYLVPGGVTCKSGHGGADTLTELPEGQKNPDAEESVDTLLEEVEIPTSKKELDIDSILSDFNLD